MRAVNRLAGSHLQVAVEYVKFCLYVHSSSVLCLNDDLAGHCTVVDVVDVVSLRGHACPGRKNLLLASVRTALWDGSPFSNFSFTNPGDQIDSLFREIAILDLEDSNKATNRFLFRPLTGLARDGNSPFCEVPSHVG
jgi:hypothetical protein